MSISVIIPSKTPSNLMPCLRAVGQHEPDAWRIVIDDGIGLHPNGDGDPDAEYEQAIPGISPFIYARNCNLGIVSAVEEGDDVVLLNDDALLQTPSGFSRMAEVAREHPEYGLIAATCNNVGNRNQWPRGIGLREDPRMVCFVCVYIPRTTIERVGLLDERFVGYGMDDDDYCLRVRQAGLKIGIFDGCYVDHGSLTSTFRGPAGAGGNYLPNLELFKQKWGFDNFGRKF